MKKMSESNHDQETPKVPKETDNRYWKSLEQWAGDPEFQKMVETEFQSSPLREESSSEEGWARREFLKLMGASLAMTSAAGCMRRPVQKIVPYNKQPEEVTIGVSNYYTSTYFDGAEGLGILVRTREGRPLKIEGNPSHPLNKGGTSARAQASILSLYDPERLQGPKRLLQNAPQKNVKGEITRERRMSYDSVNTVYQEADEAIVKVLKKGNVAVLTGHLPGPSNRQVVADFAQAFGATHYVWEPLSYDDIIEGGKAAYGDASVPYYRFDKAKVIVSVDCDFIGTWMAPTTFSHQFTSMRKDPKTMSKYVAFDSNYSLAGANADVRVRIKPSQQLDVVLGLAHEIIVKKSQTRFAGNASVKSALEPFAGAAGKLGIDAALFERLASDLAANRGSSLIVAGGMVAQTAHARDLQVAVNFLNSALENDGSTVVGGAGMRSLTGSQAALENLIEAMEAGKVNTLIIHRANPVYASVYADRFVKALRKVELVISTADRVDETSRYADYIMPDHHPMEGWGDGEFAAGVFAIQQPTIRPMYDTRSFGLTLMTWGYIADQGPKDFKSLETYYDYVRSVWRGDVLAKAGKGKSFDAFWDEALQNGVVGDTNPANGGSARSFKVDALSGIKRPAGGEYELVLYPTVLFGDGTTLANVSWLHETPDPITKIVWDNYASVSIGTAEKLKLKQGDMIEIKVGEKTAKLPTHIQPGLHDGVVAVAVGYGRTHAGKVGNGIGLNAYTLATPVKNGVVFSGQPATITKTGSNYRLAATQAHHSMEGRQIVAEATLKQYLKNESAGIHKHAVFSLWSGHAYNGHKWGMAVDLNTCTGCAACQVACQSENNIPVVGKKYVLQGREMHWLRIDRYYTGDPVNAQVVFQPVMCQQCDNAPCETVCPVLATVHTSEGLNDMVYNRCVGTRYCSNNCPYKVRRFNWFNFTKNIEKPLHLALNPDVTVRSRGVMEKCTFCVHRIKAGKAQASLEKRELKDGDIKTACQQACPTGGIVFGDLNDPNSEVAKAFKTNKRAYALLEEFHAAPAVRYLSKIRNNDQETLGNDHGHKGGHA